MFTVRVIEPRLWRVLSVMSLDAMSRLVAVGSRKRRASRSSRSFTVFPFTS